MLTESQTTQFMEEGWVVAENLFDAEALEPLRAEIARIVDGVAERLFAEGALTDRHEDESLETRLTRLLESCPDRRGEFFRAIEGKGGGGHAGEAMYGLLTHPKLLDAMESLLGPELVASSVYRIRPKVPGLDRGVVPWHQDSGYFSSHCDDSLIVTCWIPLVDATVENGCLCVLPRAHRQGVAPHHTGGNAGFPVILDDDLPPGDAVPVPVKRGGALLMTNATPHCSTVNATDTIRWSVDLRYQNKGVPNNLSLDDEATVIPENPDILLACYAPEADFVVRSPSDPASVASYAEFVRRRSLFESARLPGPGRGWKPAGSS